MEFEEESLSNHTQPPPPADGNRSDAGAVVNAVTTTDAEDPEIPSGAGSGDEEPLIEYGASPEGDAHLPSRNIGVGELLTSYCSPGPSRRQMQNALITGGLVVLWLLAAAFVGAQQQAASAGKDARDVEHLHNFPALPLTSELAYLSLLVYRFKAMEDPSEACPAVQRLNHSGYFPRGSLRCHWYHHDRSQGTQVLLVSTPDYSAIVFSGTDDVQTSLTDVDLFTTQPTYFNTTVGYDPRIRIHSGFHQAVFTGVFDNVTAQLRSVLDEQGHRKKDKKWFRPHDQSNKHKNLLFTTGHSLGAANAILTALALQATPEFHHITVQSISFGCPRIGNMYWRDFANTLTASSRGTLPIVRVVLGWDLVPRLPEFLLHVGHTFQLSKAYSWISTSHFSSDSDTDPETEEASIEESKGADSAAKATSFWNNASTSTSWNASAYYLHYGEPTRGYAGVPLGWSATPFLWVPGAMSSHSIHRYVSTLANMTKDQWASDFVRTPSAAPDDNGSENRTSPPTVDDDFYAEPPQSDQWPLVAEPA